MKRLMFVIAQTLGCALVCGAAVALPAMLATSASAQSLAVLHRFRWENDGRGPYAGLVEDAAGNLYGTTVGGGAYTSGTVFRIAPGGAETLLYSFQYKNDGASPNGSLILDSRGNLLGTASRGGSKTCECGTVFRITPAGKFAVLYTFNGGAGDGAGPDGALLADGRGNSYGTTASGGSTGCGAIGCGTVFRIGADGAESIVYFFTGRANGDGATPQNALIADAHHNLYGTTAAGGDSDLGTVFRLAPDGTETVLHSFAGSPDDGAGPYGGLVMDGAGNLYGTTGGGGSTKNCIAGCGTVFRIAPDGTETVLHFFKGGRDGSDPLSTLIFDNQGDLYGTTFSGGMETCFICGTIFRMSPDGRMLMHFMFEGGKQGSNPWAGLMIDATGHLYGTTISDGGNHVKGTVFEFTP